MPEEFLELVDLDHFLRCPHMGIDMDEPTANLDLVEFFSGKARVSRMASWCGYRVKAFDVDYEPIKHPGEFKRGKLNRSAMDLNGCAGICVS